MPSAEPAGDPPVFQLSRSAFRLLAKDEQRVVVRLVRQGRIELVDRRPRRDLPSVGAIKA